MPTFTSVRSARRSGRGGGYGARVAARLLPVAAVLLISCAVTAAATITFNLISDMHLDPEYGSPDGYGVCKNDSFPATGFKGCDAPMTLINLVVADAMNLHNAYTLYGGDWQRHGMSTSSLSTADVFNELAPSFSLIGSSSPSTLNTPRVGTTMGNNDVMPDYVFNVSESPHQLLDTQIGIMEKNGVLTTVEGEVMAGCGFYSRKVTTTLRIAVLHTLVWTYRLTPPLEKSNTDPCGQLAWLASEIDAARSAGQKLIILSHIPPLPDVFNVLSRGAIGTVESDMYWKPIFQSAYTTLLFNNRDVVAMQIYGHTHRFSFVADPSMGVPLLIVNSITPIFGNNPAYMIGDFDESIWRLVSLRQRYLDTTGKPVQILPGLEVTSALKIHNLSSMDDMRAALTNMFTDDIAWGNYMVLRTGGVVDDPCTTSFCRIYTLCAMLNAEHESISTCVTEHSGASSSSSSSSCDNTVPFYTEEQQVNTRNFLTAFISSIPALKPLWRCGNFCGWPYVACDPMSVSVAFPSSGLTGTLPAVPASVTAASQVVVSRMSLGGNSRITGTLPKNWGTLTSLEYIALQSTGITGSLPDEWSGMRNLETLYAYSTSLTGPLPSTWSSLKALKIFIVNNAKLDGTLPASWSAMSALQVLTLTTNALTGSIPPSWGTMPRLQTVRIANNKFCGCLPTQWQSGSISVSADPAVTASDCATANKCESTTTTTTTSAPIDPSVHIKGQPLFHIRPPKNWINDPNGPYRDPVTGKIHLYMQYNPNGPLWGDIAWYHVTSDDYVKWTRPESPVAMWADKWYDKWGVYSGTMINNNHSEPVAIYTCTEPENIQRQCIATVPARDLSGKRTLNSLEKSPMNPILSEDDVPGIVGLGNFRDPTEWWEDPEHPGQWLIAFVARINDAEGDNAHVVIFRTQDPTFQSGYKFSHSLYVYKYDLDKMFECPDFFKLAPAGEHYLKVSTMPSHRDYIMYGSYQLDSKLGQYVFVEDPARSFTFIDYGPLYASKTFHDPILNRRMIWGWTNDELSDAQIRSQGWSGVQNLPRGIEYDSTEKKIKTFPIPELKGLRAGHPVSARSLALSGNAPAVLTTGINATLYHEIIVTFTLSSMAPFDGTTYYTEKTAPEFGIMFRGNSNLSSYTSVSVKMPAATAAPIAQSAQDTTYAPIKMFASPATNPETNCSSECAKQRTCVSWTYTSSPSPTCALYWKTSGLVQNSTAQSGTVNIPQLYMSRTVSGSIGSTQPLMGRAPVKQANANEVELHIYVDDSVVEVFKDGGLETMTGRLYLPDGEAQTHIALYTKNLDHVMVTASAEVFTMDTVWAGKPTDVVRSYTDSVYNFLSFLTDK
ncbi:beta-fructofuranosidase-like protein [Leptomonas pyrrhocoris]|uniref:Beta-fructofuranosidase-like protein n=1 Tax=Leptomonas pyrrhocoris TaxID=157538 RepID=A0A0M9G9Y1_LEPPY|nr:beta-fructofuranosidase-like protein [Leptomonas pyrrhocoris]XP_015664369.1 beta-fructofuranosidase-like protein [Leptomonas pyrrhocoris]XP_015664370.1 beta-fructofuranosidase-like protein [Leptomonas pyrrhocoris]XP_015664371.1 beta-fructofuranosidase-like protein [Leptomonas pyrrhocoris]KPA85929.1 beta-fructofuranosidase-like protein [Leptomonas pyrrhocoris]KPA85930.1 beta-fructofuranosidase-like protein [Leptomonas pyrrhocoris]KPA85931.1 beta-fructofuranosidase-like protein [Leptomonas p|eukprot:XP_015664368.1 beta-fructofuranosidase-like protein [Leptomonas pyrrhocoris]